MSRLVAIAEFDTLAEADFARMVLEGSGIPSFLDNEHLLASGRVYGPTLTAVVRVPEPFAEEAATLLREAMPRRHAASSATCPHCGEVGASSSPWQRLGAVLSLLFGVLVPFRGSRYTCPQCGHSWK